MKHVAGWMQRGEGRHHFFDNDKVKSVCGAVRVKKSEKRFIKRWAFAPNSCKRCRKMVSKW